MLLPELAMLTRYAALPFGRANLQGLPMLRFALLTLSALLLAGTANATEPRKLALLSTVGDRLTVVTHRIETGSHVDRNLQESIAAGENVIDTMLLVEASETVRRAALPGRPTTLALRYPDAQGAATWIEGRRFTPPTDLTAALSSTGATHLLLIQPHRAPTMLHMSNSRTGSGSLEGLGFYIDRELENRRSDTGEHGIGFLAPYAYLSLVLVDVASGEVVQQEFISGSNTYSAAQNKEGVDPWNSLDAAKKVAALRGLVRREFNRTLPELLRRP